MKAILFVIFVVMSSAYCRSLPAPSVAESFSASSVIHVASIDANPTPIVRKARQFEFNYNDFDSNPYNDTPNDYDNNPYNDSAHRQTYNNFDLNPSFNDSNNNYDAKSYKNSGL